MNPSNHPTSVYRGGNLYCYQPTIQQNHLQSSFVPPSQLRTQLSLNNSSSDELNKFSRLPDNMTYYNNIPHQHSQHLYDSNYDPRLQPHMIYFQNNASLRPNVNFAFGTKHLQDAQFIHMINGYSNSSNDQSFSQEQRLIMESEKSADWPMDNMGGSAPSTLENKLTVDERLQEKPVNDSDGLLSCGSSLRNSDDSPSQISNMTLSPMGRQTPSTPLGYPLTSQIAIPDVEPTRYQKTKAYKSGNAGGSSLDALVRVIDIDQNDPERRQFSERLRLIWVDHSIKYRSLPTITKKPIDLFILYKLVKEQNGYVEITTKKRWREIANGLGIFNCQSAAFGIKRNYTKLGIFYYECIYDLNGADADQILKEIEAQKPVPGSRKRKKPRSEQTNSTISSSFNTSTNTNETSMDGSSPIESAHQSYVRMMNDETFDEHNIFKQSHTIQPVSHPYPYERFSLDMNSYRPNDFDMKFDNSNAGMYFQHHPQRMYLQSQHQMISNGYPSVSIHQQNFFVKPSNAESFNGAEEYGQRIDGAYAQRTSEDFLNPQSEYYHGNEQAYPEYSTAQTAYNQQPNVDNVFVESVEQDTSSVHPIVNAKVPDVTSEVIAENQNIENVPDSLPIHELTKLDTFCSSLCNQQRRRRLRKKKLKSDITDIWRLLMMLRSGLSGEISWALNTINSIMTDDNAFSYFNLNGIPGFGDTLVSTLKKSITESSNRHMFSNEAKDQDRLQCDDQLFNKCTCHHIDGGDDRCVATSTALRNLSFISPNKASLAKNTVFCDLLIDMLCNRLTTKDACSYYLSIVLQENALITLSNISEAVNLMSISEKYRKKLCKSLFQLSSLCRPLFTEPHLTLQLLSIETLSKLATSTLKNRDYLLTNCTDIFAQRMFTTTARWLTECDQVDIQCDLLVKAELAVCLLLFLIEKQRPNDLYALLQGLMRHTRMELQSARSGADQCAVKCVRCMLMISTSNSRSGTFHMKEQTRNWFESNLVDILFSGTIRQSSGRRRRPSSLTECESVSILISQCLRKLTPLR